MLVYSGVDNPAAVTRLSLPLSPSLSLSLPLSPSLSVAVVILPPPGPPAGAHPPWAALLLSSRCPRPCWSPEPGSHTGVCISLSLSFSLPPLPSQDCLWHLHPSFSATGADSVVQKPPPPPPLVMKRNCFSGCVLLTGTVFQGTPKPSAVQPELRRRHLPLRPRQPNGSLAFPRRGRKAGLPKWPPSPRFQIYFVLASSFALQDRLVFSSS